MNLQYRRIDPDEVDAFHDVMCVSFDVDATPQRLARFRDGHEIDRLQAAFEDRLIVGTLGAFSLQLTVPGGTLPIAGVSVVSVVPTHRRQGILRQMMAEHFADLRERGESASALWASESSIYGRFGYGIAARKAVMQIDISFAQIPDSASPTGSIRLIDLNEALDVLPRIYDSVVLQRPGMFQRSTDWWRDRVLRDDEDVRGDASAHRRAISLRAGQPAGYVLYRTMRRSEGNLVIVVELLSIDADAEKALWQFLFNLDMVSHVEYKNQPVDTPLRWWLKNPRRMERRIEDSLWLRPIDVPRMLSERRYSSSGSLILQVDDEECPWNTGIYQLDVDSDGRAACAGVDRRPDIIATPFALGSAYLGGHRFQDLARSGMISGSSDALRLADRLFAWDPLPWCQELF